jgi:AraC-like DNA-binding protein
MAYTGAMKAQFEKVPLIDHTFFAYRRTERHFPFSWHYHPEFELTLIERGFGQRFVGDSIENYGPADLVLLGPNLPHTWKSQDAQSTAADDQQAVVVQFTPEHLGAGLLDLTEMKPLKKLLNYSVCGLRFPDREEVRQVRSEMPSLISLSPGRRTLTLISILLTLSEVRKPIALSRALVRPLCRVQDEERMNTICGFLNNKLNRPISYQLLAKKTGMNQSALSRFFKRASGRTMTEYVNESRISHAARLISNTDLSILDIALQVGFGNYSHFCRQFKRFRGMAPNALRHLLLRSGRSSWERSS